jgi:uncharacterized protein (UPF0548 family)
MFFARRPSPLAIEEFLRDSCGLPLSYSPAGILTTGSERGHHLDELVAPIGRGREDFARACAALARWQHFDLGWVELHPAGAPIEAGTTVAVLVRHLGFWSLNGCRVVYPVSGDAAAPRFGFAYGTLTNHAESGEELFEVFLDAGAGTVMYRIRALSWPQAALARIGLPVARLLQARFRADSVRAMKLAVAREV